MARAIGMVELTTVSTGFKAADDMSKAADVDILQAEVTCPGKFVVLIAGDLSAVRASVDSVKGRYGDKVIDTFVLGNPHDSIFPAIYGTNQVEKIEALGILECYDVSALIVAADLAAKTAIVDLVEIRLARGMCGKSYMMITGEIAAVQAAIERAKQTVGKEGMYLDSSVIAHPDAQIRKAIL